MFKKKKPNKVEINLIDENNIKESHDRLLSNFNIDYAINVFCSIVFYKLNIMLNTPQIIAAKEIHKGAILEMATGEGKTLTIMLASYLNYLKGKNTIIVTANNYLVKRDSDQFNEIMDLLNIKSYFILGFEKQIIKKKIYSQGVVYTTINNLAFDVLRDEYRKHHMIERYESIILDEADLTLIDYANSPINITSNENIFPVNLFLVNRKLKDFSDDDYIINIKNQTVSLTEKGYHKVEEISLREGWVENEKDFYSSRFSNIIEQFKNMITANKVLKINEDYAVKGNKVKIINASTGRIEGDSSFESGLQQAVEVVNKIEPSKASYVRTMITIRTLLGRFKNISGLTGTIYGDKKEIEKSYNVKVIKMDTNVPVKRYDAPDLFFTEEKYKLDYLVKKVKDLNEKEVPVLIGTLNLKDTLEIQKRLIECGLTPNILTAENEEQESEIIKTAGKRSSITISTKIAGRGTDIVLGGDPKSYNSYDEWQQEHDYINDKGGLFVLGFERSRQRRIDDQLRGRSGRQGDNGISLFLVSLNDDILSNFNNNGSKRIFEMLNIVDKPVESKMNSRMVKVNQKNIENSYYDGRIEIARFDEENNEFRELIRDIKENLLTTGSKNYFLNMLDEYITSKVEYSLSNYTDLEIVGARSKQIKISYDEISSGDIRKCVDKIKSSHFNIKFLDSEYFDDYFFEFYFDRLNELWESMIRSMPAIRKQSQMLKMMQKIAISEYANMLESKFKNLYMDINNKAINYCLNENLFLEYVNIREIKKSLNKNIESGITIGHIDILGVGV